MSRPPLVPAPRRAPPRAGRAASIALPPALMERMAEPLAGIRDAAETRLRELAVALIEGREPQLFERLDDATKAYASAIEALRSDGLLRAQPGAVIGRFWTLPFAFEQLHQDLNEIAKLASNWAVRKNSEPAPIR